MKGSNAAIVRAACVIGLAVIAGCAAPSAVIRGTLDVPKGATDVTRSGGSHGRRSIPKSALSEAVIYVDSLPAAGRRGGPPRPEKPAPELAIASRGFAPRAVIVACGDSVVITNRDRHWHSPFSVSVPGRFELGALEPGARRVLRFEKSGIVRVFCKLHPEMSALVFVAPSPAWTQPDATGAFSLPALPPGEYELKLWHPRYGDRRWHVVLPKRGIALELGL